MHLITLSLANFRCYERVDFSEIGQLAVFIGENDAGKTVILDAVELLTGNKPCSAKDFRRLTDGCHTESMAVHGEFLLDVKDTLPEEFRSGPNNDQLKISRCFVLEGNAIHSKVLVAGSGFNEAGFDNFDGAGNQKILLESMGLKPASNDLGRRQQVKELIALMVNFSKYKKNYLFHLPKQMFWQHICLEWSVFHLLIIVPPKLSFNGRCKRSPLPSFLPKTLQLV